MFFSISGSCAAIIGLVGAVTSLVAGILTALFSVSGNILSAVSGGDLNYFSLVLGLALPVLYLIGAFQNRRVAVA